MPVYPGAFGKFGLTKEAEFKIHAQPQEIYYLHQRGVTVSETAEVPSMGFIRQKRGIIIAGPTGGKTFVCCAIGTAAVRRRYSVRYFHLSSLFEGDGSYKSYASKLRSRDLLQIGLSRYRDSLTTSPWLQFVPRGYGSYWIS
ncbi:MAG: ATP-binding protein [Acidimicrobiaceae bacterium]|nr:ATP-binding protein [Acidimicrobiaceae bacterium]